VAVAVASGLADAALGVRAAARALGLEFIFVANEQYDLACLHSFLASERGIQLADVIRSDSFKVAVASLGGYDTSSSGEILYQQ
jgi:putative molybdopterin biosynthesis protein